eukprot:gene29886-36806_t
MVDFCRDNQLPRVSIEKFSDSILDFFLGDDIAMTYDFTMSELLLVTGWGALCRNWPGNIVPQPGNTFEPDKGSSNRK